MTWLVEKRWDLLTNLHWRGQSSWGRAGAGTGRAAGSPTGYHSAPGSSTWPPPRRLREEDYSRARFRSRSRHFGPALASILASKFTQIVWYSYITSSDLDIFTSWATDENTIKISLKPFPLKNPKSIDWILRNPFSILLDCSFKVVCPKHRQGSFGQLQHKAPELKVEQIAKSQANICCCKEERHF